MKTKHDLIFADEELYFRKKIKMFDIQIGDILCFYFYLEEQDGFCASAELDYIEIEECMDIEKVKNILTKETIKKKDMVKLIQLFHHDIDEEDANAIVNINPPYIFFENFNETYFSIDKNLKKSEVDSKSSFD